MTVCANLPRYLINLKVKRYKMGATSPKFQIQNGMSSADVTIQTSVAEVKFSQTS